jgi:hypothetical protein
MYHLMKKETQFNWKNAKEAVKGIAIIMSSLVVLKVIESNDENIMDT